MACPDYQQEVSHYSDGYYASLNVFTVAGAAFVRNILFCVVVAIFRKLLVHICDSLGTLTLYGLDFQYIWLSIWGGLSLLTLCAWWNGISWVLPFWK